MQTTPGARLGPYEIVSRIGAGGMGEVFLARDTRLERNVAIKVLPTDLAQNVQFRLRFEREARTISQLSHPHICTLYDVGDGYLVMELLDGESLADRLARGPLPLKDVMRYGIEIAGALDRAHRAGVVHRDLKPGNVMLTKSGAKLLDFGLAKSNAIVEITGDTATQHKPLTQEGTILGTFQYMAPEQLEGVEADARTDIFALGAVLYEMATGARAFDGKTKTSLIAAIVDRDPVPISSLQPLTPPALEHVISKCLSKDPDDRWQSAHDIAEELRWIKDAGSQAGAAIAVTTHRKNRERVAWTIAAVAAVVALAATALAWRATRATAPLRVMRFTVPSVFTPRRTDVYGLLAISPDGSEIVYAAQDKATTRLFRRAIDRPDPVPIDGTEGGKTPFFSPDGKWVGFFAHHKLMKVALSGGQPITICTATEPRGAVWADDDTIVFCPFYYGGIERVSASGGTPRAVSTVNRASGERSHRWPQLLPGGKVVIYSVGYGGNWDDAKIVAQQLDSSERKVLISGGCDARYVPTGHLVYVRGTSVYAVPFDAKKLEVSGQPVQVATGVANHSAGGGEFAFAPNGMLVYYSPGVSADEAGTLSIINHHGEKQAVALPPAALGEPRFSPDGTKLVGMRIYEVWTFDLARGTSTRLTSGPRTESPIWSPDSLRIIYGSERDGPWSPYWRAADRSDEERSIVRSAPMTPVSISSDGRELLVNVVRKDTGADLAIVSIADGHIRPFAQTEADEPTGMFSPDGKWIAWESDESGRAEVYVRSSAGAPGRWQISTEGGGNPRWVLGNEIVFQNGSKLVSVAVKTQPAFSAAPPQLLIERAIANYDVAADGRIVIQEAPDSVAPGQLNVVLNWFEEIRARSGATGK